MPTITWNPGEFVFDQTTGEPYIDAAGETFLVAPGLQISTSDGRTIDGDDVANAAYYRANKFEGETLRDRSIGVPFLQLALGQGDIAQAVDVIAAEVRRRTPGVSGVVSTRVVGLNPVTRVLQWTAIILRQGGDDQTATFTTVG